MTGVVRQDLTQLSHCFFALEGAFYHSANQPLKSLTALHQHFQALQTQLPEAFAPRAQLNQIQDLLRQLVSESSFLPYEAQAALLAWTSELRSQCLAQYAFQLTPDWQPLERLWRSFWQAYRQASDSLATHYCGVFDGDIWSGLADLDALSDLGFWRIQNGLHPIYEATDQAQKSLSIWLSSTLTLAELGRRFAHWQWQYAACNEHAIELDATHTCQDSQDWLHLMASERSLWRKNATMRQLYQSLQQHVSSHYSQRVDSLVSGLGRGLEIRYDVLQYAQQAQYCELYGGQLWLLDSALNMLETHRLTNTSLPVYRLTFADETFVIPAYRVEPRSQDQQGQTRLTYQQGQWQTLTSACQGERESLLVQALGKRYVVEADRIERDYAVVQKAPILPAHFNNCWRVRDDFLFELSFADECFQRVSAVTLALGHARSDADWLALQIASHSQLVLPSQSVMAVLPAGQVERLASGLMYCSGHVVPLIQSADIRRDSDIIALVGTASTAVFALQAERVKVATTEPEELLEKKGVVLNWVNDSVNLTLSEWGHVLFDDQAIRACHQQLVEIFV